jgi:hypothetical protein
MIDWGVVADVVVAVVITVILWWISRHARRHPIEEGL